MPKPLEERVEQLEKEVASVKGVIDQLKRGVDQNNEQTADMYEVFSSLRGGFKVIEWLGRIAVPLGTVLGFIGAGYIFWKTGVWQKP